MTESINHLAEVAATFGKTVFFLALGAVSAYVVMCLSAFAIFMLFLLLNEFLPKLRVITERFKTRQDSDK